MVFFHWRIQLGIIHAHGPSSNCTHWDDLIESLLPYWDRLNRANSIGIRNGVYHPTSNHYMFSFLTTSFIMGLSCDGGQSSLKLPLPTIFCEYNNLGLFLQVSESSAQCSFVSLKHLHHRIFCSSYGLAEMITNKVSFSPKNTYFRCVERSFSSRRLLSSREDLCAGCTRSLKFNGSTMRWFVPRNLTFVFFFFLFFFKLLNFHLFFLICQQLVLWVCCHRMTLSLLSLGCFIVCYMLKVTFFVIHLHCEFFMFYMN